MTTKITTKEWSYGPSYEAVIKKNVNVAGHLSVQNNHGLYSVVFNYLASDRDPAFAMNVGFSGATDQKLKKAFEKTKKQFQEDKYIWLHIRSGNYNDNPKSEHYDILKQLFEDAGVILDALIEKELGKSSA